MQLLPVQGHMVTASCAQKHRKRVVTAACCTLLLATLIRSRSVLGQTPHGGRIERRLRREGLRTGGRMRERRQKDRLTVPSEDTCCRLSSARSQGGRWGERRARGSRKCSELNGDRARAWRRSSRKMRAEPGSGGGRKMSHRQMKSGVGRSVARLGARGGGEYICMHCAEHSIYGLYRWTSCEVAVDPRDA